MVCITCNAANPTIYSFTNFNTQFTTPDGTNMVIKSGAVLTNVVLSGTTTGSGTVSTNNLPGLLPALANTNGNGLTNLNITNIVGNIGTNNIPGLLPQLANTNGGGLTNLTATNFTGIVPIANGGTATNVSRNVGRNVGVFQMSPAVADTGALTNMLLSTPSFVGQLGVSYYGNFISFLWASASTTQGDWSHSMQIGGGLAGAGDPVYSDPLMVDTIFELNGSPTGWARTGDSYVIARNWSTNANNSGSSIGVAVMGGADSQGKATNVSNNGATFTHVPYNRISTLMPGNAMLVFNKDTDHLKGFAIAGPNLSGLGSGNYSMQYNDFNNKLFRIPFWVSGAYQPSDAGWLDTVQVNPLTGAVGISNGITTLRELRSAGNSNSAISWGLNSAQISADGFGNIQVGLAGNSNNATFTKFKGAATGTAFASGVRFDSDGAGSGLNYSLETHSIGGVEIGMKGSALIVGSLGSEGTAGGFNVGPTITVGYGCTNAGDVAGNATFQIIGSIATYLTNQSANYTVPVTNSTILMNGSGITNALPRADFHSKGRQYTIKNLNAAALTVNATNSQTFDGGISNIFLAQNDAVTVQSDGANWQNIGGYRAFTLIQTNFNSGQIYTNSYGAPILVSANATLTTTGVSGNASLSLQIAGTITNQVGISTIVTSIAQSYTNSISAMVPYNSTYTFTNTSAGAGDSAGVNGGQILVY